MKTKTIIIFVVVALVMFMFKPLKYLDLEVLRQSSFCKAEERALTLDLNGVIVDKYLDSKNHNYETVEVQTDNGVIKTRFLVLEQNRVFDTLNIGDDIVKQKNELSITVNNTGYDLNYSCKRK